MDQKVYNLNYDFTNKYKINTSTWLYWNILEKNGWNSKEDASNLIFINLWYKGNERIIHVNIDQFHLFIIKILV